ncbi:MAG: hypothetical protein ACRDHZ_14040, partial [Ktedonobacteraceae bacterium]
MRRAPGHGWPGWLAHHGWLVGVTRPADLIYGVADYGKAAELSVRVSFRPFSCRATRKWTRVRGGTRIQFLTDAFTDSYPHPA